MERAPEQPDSSSTSVGASILPGRQQPEPASLDYTHMLLHLFSMGQMLCGQTHEVVDRLCREVLLATQEQAHLVLRYQQPSWLERTAFSPTTMAVSFTVQFRDRVYGTLHIAPDKVDPTRPALPLAVAHLLVHVCGWLLYTFEVSACFQGQPHEHEQPVHRSLTKRERDVLALICRGYDQQAIAQALSITPATVKKHRQHMYEQLGVRNAHDALLAAYRAGLFSPLPELFDDLPPQL